MNWERGLLRVWLVAGGLWAITVGWISWPGDAIEQYGRYWYFRAAHSEVLDERRANAAQALRRQHEATAEIRARHDRSRATQPKANENDRDIRTPRQLTGEDLRRIPGIGGIPPGYGRQPSQISDQELEELEKEARTKFVEPGSEKLQEFDKLEREYNWDETRSSWWAMYTFGPPIVAFIVGVALLWALRGFSPTRT